MGEQTRITLTMRVEDARLIAQALRRISRDESAEVLAHDIETVIAHHSPSRRVVYAVGRGR